MATRHLVSVLFLAIAAIGGSAVAFQQQPAPGRGAGTPGGPENMRGMMAECQEHHRAIDAALDKALAAIRDARGSSDPARLRAALDQVESSLTDIEPHVSGCTAMMTRLSDMISTMMGMMGGRQGMRMMRGGGGTPPSSGR